MANEAEIYRLDRRDRYEVEDSSDAPRPLEGRRSESVVAGGFDVSLARLYLSGRRDRYEQDDVGARPVVQARSGNAPSRPVVLVGSADGEEDPSASAFVGA